MLRWNSGTISIINWREKLQNTQPAWIKVYVSLRDIRSEEIFKIGKNNFDFNLKRNKVLIKFHISRLNIRSNRKLNISKPN